MPIQAVLFDFDGTLADTLPLSFTAFKAVFRQYENRDVTNDELVAMFGPTEEEIIEANFSNKAAVPQAVQDYFSIYETGHAGESVRNQEIAGLLQWLKDQGIKTAVITGKGKRAYRISSEALNMRGIFQLAITGDDVEKPKPDPEGIHKALDILGIDPADAVFIGDSNADILAGKAAGLRTYGVRWLSTYQSQTYDVEPDGVFSHVSEFLEVLAEERR
ncbi:Pyrophosphatase PpaX [Paenibacillus auburnensis]|uniref:Pyrophosphatase PpaX n=1 Tax=Paenibacillus auburnensis TaxID=2905649 RepID=A0ABM9CQK0_9BACL|nr:HAD family hydrolase [Paenibacillus auburnensis]CAH1220408.1 Pyrophosphatase PpaX [Paenibacillus auburnensis]